MQGELVEVASYARRVAADETRVWENVLDWAHLPWLHRESFASIELREAGAWGWRARARLRAGGDPFELELLVDREASRYVTRTLSGPTAGSEIWTQVTPVGARAAQHTDIEVSFWLPGVDASAREPLGAAYVALYTRLWDEDEEMMRLRAERIARPGPVASRRSLGNAAALRTRLPLEVDLDGVPVWVAVLGDEIVAYDARCPHRLGPLPAPDAAGAVECPWHGYRFDAASGRSQGCAESLRLRRVPTAVDVLGELWLGPG